MTNKKRDTIAIPEYNIAVVKFNDQMAETVPQLSFGVVLDVAKEFGCNSAKELIDYVNGFYSNDTIEKRQLVKQADYINMAVSILFHTTSMAYELQNKPIDFNRAQVKMKVSLTMASYVHIWFMNEGVSKLNIENNSPNEKGIIRIT